MGEIENIALILEKGFRPGRTAKQEGAVENIHLYFPLAYAIRNFSAARLSIGHFLAGHVVVSFFEQFVAFDVAYAIFLQRVDK